MTTNDERFEALRMQAAQNQVVPQVVQQPQEMGLSFVVPTEHVTLPSKGLFYPPEHPLHGKDTVEIKQMTAKEEDILTNRSYIKKGIVLDKLIDSVLVDKRILSETLLLGDRNAIILALRITGYGNDYNISVSCASCGQKQVKDINLTEFVEMSQEKLDKKLENVQDENFARLPTGNIFIKLPQTKWLVECRLLNGADEKRMLNIMETKKKVSNSDEISVTDQMSLMVVSIQSVSDRSTIGQALKVMPASDAKYLRKVYQDLIPSFDMKIDHICEFCEHEQEVEVPFTQEFFWPK